jgi:hypothetical protein
MAFYKANSIPKNGNWDDVSGETFLRKLLSMPIEEARYQNVRTRLHARKSSVERCYMSAGITCMCASVCSKC